MRRVLGPTLVRQVKAASAVAGRRADQTLVLQELERRVQRARAGSPQVVGPTGQLLQHLVTVHRTLAEQGENSGADIAPPPPATTSPTGRASAEAAAAPRASSAPGPEAVVERVVSAGSGETGGRT